jgi:hypothetical protein
MIPLTQNYLPKRSRRKRISVLIIIIGLIGSIIPGFTTQNTPIVLAVAETIPWNLTLHITEASGTGNTIVLGEKPDASNGQDRYDLPEPPAPPQFPYILAWFETPFPVPFDKLLQEYKQYPSSRSVWNLSILWVAKPGNNSPTTISINWDSSSIAASDHFSLLMYEDNTVVANMLIDHSYSFSTTGTLHRFQIIGQSESSNSTSEKNEIPLLPIITGIVVLLIIVVLFFFYSRRKK